LKDKKQRTKLPESIYLINNIISNSQSTLKLIQPISNLTSLGNQYANSANQDLGFSPLTSKVAVPLDSWLAKIDLDMDWQENIDLVIRMRATTSVRFITSRDKLGNEVLPLTAPLCQTTCRL
jgi:hypothetical protein